MLLPTDKELKMARRVPLFDVDNFPLKVNHRGNMIERLLPHRGNFLLVEHIVGIDFESKRLVGERTLLLNDPMCDGHFPDAPIYPGVLLVEMTGQHALCFAALEQLARSDAVTDKKPSPVRLIRIHDASFINEARPGDQLTILTQVFDHGGWTFMALGQVYRQETLISVSLFEAMLVEE
jgi:3-hydroxyacyl-[acyl-carrier-protein] dehydratase